MRQVENQYEILSLPDHFNDTPVDRIIVDWQGLELEFKIEHKLTPAQQTDSISAGLIMGVTASAVFSIAMALSIIIVRSLG